MHFFRDFTSNTLAGTGNQSVFINQDEMENCRGRIFYKIFKSGVYPYSFLFSNVIDSTFSAFSYKNMICDSWFIDEINIGVCKMDENIQTVEFKNVIPLTFQGETSKKVMPGEVFFTDPITLNVHSDEYLCVDICFRGKMMPCLEEAQIPSFRCENGRWTPSKHVPFPSMVGCKRDVKLKIGFLGDSITQGIGVTENSYAHWNALLAEQLGKENSYWNLGLGRGQAGDAASNGTWLFKAKQTELAIVCFGVNDILIGQTAEQIKSNLYQIVKLLKDEGICVVLQTVPPFDFQDEKLKVWTEVNIYIKDVLSREVKFVFDVASFLGLSHDKPQIARYGGHPNEQGCQIWANEFYPLLKDCIEKLIND